MHVRRVFARHRLRNTGKGRKFPLLATVVVVLLIVVVFFAVPVLKTMRGPFGAFVSHVGVLKDMNILVLLQNEAELRPTGGFITAVGLVETEGGKPSVTFFDSYSIAEPNEAVRAPMPIEEVFSQDPKYRGWTFRDANFSPDFPESTKSVLELLKNDPRFAETAIDAVVAVNIAAAENILSFLGPVDETNADNLYMTLQRATKDVDLHSEEDLGNRKDILGELAHALLDRIGYLNLPDILELAAASADHKDIQFWFQNPELEAIIQDKNWGGALPDRDFFGVNMANLGAKKSDRYIRKYYYSEVSIGDDGSVTEWLSLRIKHAGRDSLLSGEGRYYIRVFRPIGATLLASAQEWNQRTVDDRYEEFSLLTTFRPGEKQEISVNFSLPQKWGSGDRFFNWVSQSGADEFLFLTVRGSGETTFSAEGCDVTDPRDNILFCDITLDRDRTIMVRLFPDTYPPLLENVFFDNANEVFLRFSEPISSEPIPPESFSLVCDESSYPFTNIVQNESDRRDLRGVLATTVTFDGRFCRFSINGLRDAYGNVTDIETTLPLREGEGS